VHSFGQVLERRGVLRLVAGLLRDAPDRWRATAAREPVWPERLGIASADPSLPRRPLPEGGGLTVIPARRRPRPTGRTRPGTVPPSLAEPPPGRHTSDRVECRHATTRPQVRRPHPHRRPDRRGPGGAGLRN